MSVPVLRRTALAAAAAALALATAATAQGAPTISGADGDVWNAAKPTPTYTITASNRRLRIFWSVSGGGGSGSGATPLTVTLPGIKDGSYTLQAAEGRNSGDLSQLIVRRRTFRVDVTAPTVTIAAPVAGAVFEQGATVLADYACAGAATCAGPVADGAAIDTASPGDKDFRVLATDDAGNTAAGDAGYGVVAPGPPPAETSGGPPPLAPPAPEPAREPAAPSTINAKRLRPARGAAIATLRPVFRWPRLDRARFYNLQVFRLKGSKAVKVFSVFPRGTSYRVPPRRLGHGARYVWRLWPYVSGGYTRRPLGLSFFDVRSAPGR